VCASVVAHGDPAPVLEFSEHVLDLVALFIKRFAVASLFPAVLTGRDTGLDAFFLQGLDEPVRVVPAIRHFAFGNGVLAWGNY